MSKHCALISVRVYIFTSCKLIMMKRAHAAQMSVQAQRGKKEKSLAFHNDVHTETMGRRSD